MHRLLEQQIKNITDANGMIDVAQLLPLVSAAYDEQERDRRLARQGLEHLQAEIKTLYRRARTEADSRFTVIMNNVGEAVVVMDRDGIIVSFNAAAERLFGYGEALVVGHSITMLMPEAVACGYIPMMQEYMRGERPDFVGTNRETSALHCDGEVFPIEVTVGEARDGESRQFIAIVRDITKRKQTEQTLKESESRFRDLVGSASDWFWETGPDHHLTFVSERINLVLGVNASAIVGLSFIDLGMGDDPALSAVHMADLEAQQPFRDRVFHVGPEEGKDSRSIRISGVPIYDKLGLFTGYRGVGIDVTREAAAERRARQAQQRLADAIESLDDGIALYDSADRLVLCNSVYQTVFSSTGREILPGTTFEDILRSNEHRYDVEGMDFQDWLPVRLDHHRRAQGDPMIVRMADGRWFLNRDFRTADRGVVSVRTDITQLQQKQDEIERLKSRYELILDSAGEGIVGLDNSGHITFANRAAGTILGWSCDGIPADVPDMEQLDFHPHVQDRPQDGSQSPVEQAYGAGIGTRISGDTFRKADRTPLPADYYVAPITETTGTVTGAVLVFRDATLRQQYERTLADSQRELERLVAERTQELSREVEVRAHTEAALRESRERLKGLTNALFEGVLVITRDGFIAFANPSAKRLLRMPEGEEIEGFPVESLFSLRSETDQPTPWQTVITSDETILNDDAVFTLADGSKIPVAFACSPSAGDSSRAAILSFRDIALLKDAQNEALQASRMASVGQLAAGIAHEINTPTQYIGDNLRFIGDSFADVARLSSAAAALAHQAEQAGLTKAAQDYLHAADQADLDYLCGEIPLAVQQSLEGVSQVSRIVLSMKEFSHPGSSSKTQTDLNLAIQNTLTVSRNTWKHVAEVETDFDPDLPQLLCYAGELNQVFLNLIVNAAHAIEESGKGGVGLITITTRRDGDDLMVQVSDSGNGVPESLRDRIFDPFFTTKPVGKGTGQGLAICRDVVVTKHKGRIAVGGDPGQGAVFTVRLPMQQEETSALPAEESPS